MKAGRKRLVYVVPFFLDGWIQEMRVYSDVMKAQAALRRYVGYSKLLDAVKRRESDISRSYASVLAYGAIHRTPYAGTQVWEIEIDDPRPGRRPSRPVSEDRRKIAKPPKAASK